MSSKALDIKNPYKDLLDNSHIDIGVSELKKNDKAAGSFSERFSRSVCQRALRCKALGKALYWSRITGLTSESLDRGKSVRYQHFRVTLSGLKRNQSEQYKTKCPFLVPDFSKCGTRARVLQRAQFPHLNCLSLFFCLSKAGRRTGATAAAPSGAWPLKDELGFTATSMIGSSAKSPRSLSSSFDAV